MRVVLPLVILLSLSGFGFLWLWIRGRKAENIISVTGVLVRSYRHKNLDVGKMKRRIVPNATDYVYSVVINGKKREISGFVCQHHKYVRKRVTFYHQKGLYWPIYMDEYTGLVEQLLCICCFGMAVVCLLATLL